MKFWNQRSIAGKLTRMNLMVSGAALVLAYIAFLGYDLYTLRQGLVRSLSTEAGIVGANSVTALLFDDRQAAENTLSALHESPQIKWAIVVRGNGEQFAEYARDPSIDPNLTSQLGPGQSSRYWVSGRNILFGSRILFQGNAVGSVYLLAETTQLEHSALQFGWLSAGILVLCFAIALLATTTIRHLVTDPLTGLAETAQIVSREKDYSVRAVPPRTEDELAFLVRSFNEMLEQIQERDRALEESRSILEERVKERTAELTSTNKELEAFSYSVAHDLRGPLQQISNIAFLLQNSSPKGENEGLIEKLFEGSKRMSALIEDLLNLSRATSTPMRRTAVDLSSMAEEILTTLKAENGGRQAHFTVAKGARAIADEGLTHVVLENLLNNAWKYTAKSKAAEIEFGYTEEARGTVYFVRDNGAGFDPRYADRLFRPFQRLHSQGEFPGTGIGLATASRIIGRHGGKIWARSKVDEGAVFYFTLPYNGEK